MEETRKNCFDAAAMLSWRWRLNGVDDKVEVVVEISWCEALSTWFEDLLLLFKVKVRCKEQEHLCWKEIKKKCEIFGTKSMSTSKLF